MQHRANKWLLSALLVLLTFSMSIFLAIPKAKADTPDKLNNKFTQITGGYAGSNFYKLPLGLAEYDINEVSIRPDYMRLQYHYNVSSSYNFMNIIPFKYLMSHRNDEYSPLVMNLYNEIVVLTGLYLAVEGQPYGGGTYTYFLFGANQLSIANVYNYIIDNNLYTTNSNVDERISKSDFESLLWFSCDSALVVYGGSSTNNITTYKNTPRFIVLNQTLYSPVNPTNFDGSTLNDTYFYKPYNFTYLFNYMSLPTTPANDITNDNLLLQYYGLASYLEISSPSIDAIELSAYYEGIDEGARDILQNPNDYGLYTTNQYNTHANAEYQRGLQIGRETPYTTGTWFTTIFTGIGDIMSIEILPHLSIGLIVSIPLVISLAWFIIRTFRGGGS